MKYELFRYRRHAWCDRSVSSKDSNNRIDSNCEVSNDRQAVIDTLRRDIVESGVRPEFEEKG